MRSWARLVLPLAVSTYVGCGGGGGGGAGGAANPGPFVVSGVVTGAIQAGVTVTLTSLADASVLTTMTHADGSYAFTGVGKGTFRAAPAPGTHVFTPDAITFSVTDRGVAGLDFVASLGRVLSGERFVSSWVDSASGRMAGVTITLTSLLDASAITTVTDANGQFTFAHVADGDYWLGASKAGYGFGPGWDMRGGSVTVSGADWIAGWAFIAFEDEANFSPATATPLAFDAVVLGTLGISDWDHDFFSFVVPQGGATVRVQCLPTGTGCPTTSLYQAGVTLPASAGGGACYDGLVPLAAGTYDLELSSMSYLQTYPLGYSIRVSIP